jgi:hypothetical protein
MEEARKEEKALMNSNATVGQGSVLANSSTRSAQASEVQLCFFNVLFYLILLLGTPCNESDACKCPEQARASGTGIIRL